MAFSQPKKITEAERVKAWKHKNPDKVANQRHRRRGRIMAERRASDPTGELDYGPIDGVDEPYPDSSEIPPVMREPEPSGIEEPLDFALEMTREEKRAALIRMRAEVAKIQPKPYDPNRS